jgi:hypothetical protein
MAPSAISYAVIRGEKIAEEKGAQVMDELLNIGCPSLIPKKTTQRSIVYRSKCGIK